MKTAQGAGIYSMLGLENAISSAWFSRRTLAFWLSNHLSRSLDRSSLWQADLCLPLETHEDEGPAGIYLQPGIVVLVFVTWSHLWPFGSSHGAFSVWMPCSWRVRRLVVKESPLLVAPNHPWLSLSRFWLLPSCVCQRPYHCACDLLLAVILVMIGTYLLFNAGSPSSCICLRKEELLLPTQQHDLGL